MPLVASLVRAVWHDEDLSDEDVASIVVYLRSLPPVHNHLSKTGIIFPVKYLIRSVPEPLTAPVAAPDPADCVKYGQYLVKIGGCADCHTPQDQGQPIAGFEFAGGTRTYDSPWRCVPRITSACTSK
jgi:hypothetical protein